MHLSFFGVRGSCPCAGAEYHRVGGNTSCVLVSVDGEAPLVLDLGTGLRAAGEALGGAGRRGGPLLANALLTHLHLDHILGLPFFSPLHEQGAHLTLYGPGQDGPGQDGPGQDGPGQNGPGQDGPGQDGPGQNGPGQNGDVLRSALERTFRPPLFPVTMMEFGGKVDVREVTAHEGADPLELGRIRVRAARVPHPGHTLGFRVEAEGRSVVYVPDHQAPQDRNTVSPAVRALCEDADLLLHDAQYTDEEFEAKSGWGHSTVAYAVRVAAESGVRRLVLFHHDPSRTDREVDALLTSARGLADARRLEEVTVAREGTTVSV